MISIHPQAYDRIKYFVMGALFATCIFLVLLFWHYWPTESNQRLTPALLPGCQVLIGQWFPGT